MEFRVGSAPARSVGFSHGNKFLMLVLNLHWCVCVCVCLIFKRLHCCISKETHP